MCVPPAPCSLQVPPLCPGELWSDQSETSAAPSAPHLSPRGRPTARSTHTHTHTLTGGSVCVCGTHSCGCRCYPETLGVAGRTDGVTGQFGSVGVGTLVEDQLTRLVLTNKQTNKHTVSFTEQDFKCFINLS